MIQDKIEQYIKDPENGFYNYELGIEYEKIGQTASAISYFLRAAERIEDKNLVCQSLLHAADCFYIQKRRNFTVEGLLQYALSILPDNIEVYYKLSEFYEKIEKWRESSLYANLGLKFSSDLSNSDLYLKIMYQKGIADWKTGLWDEAKETLKQVREKTKDEELLTKISIFFSKNGSAEDQDNFNDYIFKQYISSMNTQSDINEHLPVLLNLAKECDHITEMGVRSGMSTRAFLNSKAKLISYDIEENEEVLKIINFARDSNKEVEFIKADVREIDIEETDLLFIDTLHTYNQLKKELELHGNKSKKYIVFHDTITYGLKDEVECETNKHGLLPAIIEFLIDNKHWRFKKFFTNNNGLTVLERVQNDS